MFELTQLAEKDPEFYKYLQENDRELLEFKAPQGMDDAMDEDDIMDEAGGEEGGEGEEEAEEGLPVLSAGILKTWQRALLDVNLRFLNHMCLADLMSIAPFFTSPP